MRGSRVIINGRPYPIRGYQPFKPGVAARNADGELIELGAPIPPESPESPFREGIAYTDPEDGLTYRVIRRCDPREGWAPIEFWTGRYMVTFKSIKFFVEKGWLDAAIETGSPTKRYRCRDEAPIVKHLIKARPWKAKQVYIKLPYKSVPGRASRHLRGAR